MTIFVQFGIFFNKEIYLKMQILFSSGTSWQPITWLNLELQWALVNQSQQDQANPKRKIEKDTMMHSANRIHLKCQIYFVNQMNDNNYTSNEDALFVISGRIHMVNLHN
jgi:hypothetical protein